MVFFLAAAALMGRQVHPENYPAVTFSIERNQEYL
jgi:hypothetical protein